MKPAVKWALAAGAIYLLVSASRRASEVHGLAGFGSALKKSLKRAVGVTQQLRDTTVKPILGKKLYGSVSHLAKKAAPLTAAIVPIASTPYLADRDTRAKVLPIYAAYGAAGAAAVTGGIAAGGAAALASGAKMYQQSQAEAQPVALTDEGDLVDTEPAPEAEDGGFTGIIRNVDDALVSWGLAGGNDEGEEGAGTSDLFP